MYEEGAFEQTVIKGAIVLVGLEYQTFASSQHRNQQRVYII
jgi:hypothetical protein